MAHVHRLAILVPHYSDRWLADYFALEDNMVGSESGQVADRLDVFALVLGRC